MISWIKKNKLVTILLVIVAFFVYKYFLGYLFGINNMSFQKNASYGLNTEDAIAPSGVSLESRSIGLVPQTDYAPQADVDERLVIQESNLSLLVKDVVSARDKILEYANSNEGYMVTTSTSNPEDAPNATVVIRIPSDKLENTLDYFHSLSVKVVSENLVGKDVTDQYLDIETRITQIERTKARLEAILESATRISDITDITQQILNYQNQIDSLKGRQIALEKNAQLAKLTIYLSTDEIALPYAPSDTFRPKVIFKLAVRSLIGSLRDIGEIVIWIGVYSVVWLPTLIIFVFVRRWWIKRQNKTPQ